MNIRRGRQNQNQVRKEIKIKAAKINRGYRKKVIESFYLVLPKSYQGKIGVDPTTGSTVVLAQTGKSHRKGLEIASRLFNVAIENPPYEEHPLNPENAGMHSFVVGANIKRGQLWVDHVDGYWDTEYKTDYIFTYMVQAVALAELGCIEEAKGATSHILRIDPGYSLRTFAETQPFRDAKVLDRHVRGLRTAGLPE